MSAMRGKRITRQIACGASGPASRGIPFPQSAVEGKERRKGPQQAAGIWKRGRFARPERKMVMEKKGGRVIDTGLSEREQVWAVLAGTALVYFLSFI